MGGREIALLLLLHTEHTKKKPAEGRQAKTPPLLAPTGGRALSVFTCLFAVCSFEAPLADMLTERRRTVRKRYEALQQRRALQDTTNQHRASTPNKDTPILQPGAITSVLVLPSPLALHLDSAQKLQLQQQVQQVGVAPPSRGFTGERCRVSRCSDLKKCSVCLSTFSCSLRSTCSVDIWRC